MISPCPHWTRSSTWPSSDLYDHKVSVSNPVLKEDDGVDAAAITLADGTYTIEVGFEGGSGKSHVLTPCTLKVENGDRKSVV